MNVTIKKIAELANVSRGTVDKVLNNRPGIKDETKERVLEIARSLNYKPNLIGKTLVSRQPVKIGIILTPDYNPFIQEMINGIKQADEEYSTFNLEVSIQMLTTLEPAEQIAMLDNMKKQGFAGLAVFPLDNPQVKAQINSLIADGIAVMTFNSKVEGINDFCFVGQNHVKGGATAAGLMAKLLPEDPQIGVIISSYDLSCHTDRLKGFTDRLHSWYPDLNLVDVQENQDISSKAFELTLDYCNRFPNLNGIYITGGGISGVGNALKLAKKEKMVKVICHDVVFDTVQLMKEGIVDFAIAQNPELQGYQLVKVLFEYLVKKQEPKSKTIEIPVYIISEDNME